MAIISYVSEDEFIDTMMSQSAKFSYEACEALYDWYNEWSFECGENVVFDPVGIRCEWSEYDSAEEALEDMGELMEGMDEEEMEDKLNEMFSCIWCSNGSILVHNG